MIVWRDVNARPQTPRGVGRREIVWHAGRPWKGARISSFGVVVVLDGDVEGV